MIKRKIRERAKTVVGSHFLQNEILHEAGSLLVDLPAAKQQLHKPILALH